MPSPPPPPAIIPPERSSTPPATLEEILEDGLLTANVEDVRTALRFIESVRNATLNTSGLDDEQIFRIQNPLHPREVLDDLEEPSFQHALGNFVELSGTTADSVYDRVRATYLRRHPEEELLSYDQIKRRVQALTGIVALEKDMCVNSCIAYTGPWEELETCMVCGEGRYKENGVDSRKKFTTFLLGPQLQAQCLRDVGYGRLGYRASETQKMPSVNRGNLHAFIHCGMQRHTHHTPSHSCGT